MNKKLQKQIKVYAGFAGALLAADKSIGQVVYVDISPDTLVTGDPIGSGYHHFLLDVNNDNVNDFDFAAKHQIAGSTTSWNAEIIHVTPLNNAELRNKFYYTYPSGSAPFPEMLAPGDTINANGLWMNNPNQCIWGEWHTWMLQHNPINYSGGCGGWNWLSDGCLPFRLVQNGDYYYGWIRMHILSGHSVLVKEYSYQSQPNVPIFACDTTNLATGISEYNTLQFNFSQQNNSIYISTLQKFNHANISVYDLLGKEILQQPFEAKETTITIDKKGIYFVEVKSEKGIFRKKFFIY